MATEKYMSSLNEKCNDLKARYDDCFNKWFRDSFLKGKDDHDETCGEFFSAYKQCLHVSIAIAKF